MVGVLAVSFSAILIRLADAPPLAVAFYRNAMAASLLLPVVLARHRGEIRSLTRRQWGLAALAGALLAVHFATWIPSLDYTTVAASTVLVTTQPVWVALIGRVTLGERVVPRAAAGIGLSLAGAAVISGGDFGLSARAAFGDLLALAGAIAVAGYVLSGRSLRRHVSLLTYVGIAYTVCAGLLALAMLASRTPFTGFEPKTWGLFVLMALVPHILGHTVFNYLLAHVEAAVVAIAVMGEPVGASLLALVILGEVPPWATVAGSVLVLAGIYVAVAAQTRRVLEAPLE